MSNHHITEGNPDALGATASAEGTNFALFSAHAEAVDLCLFDPQSGEQITSMPLPARSGDIWHGFAPTVRAGTCYGYRVHGPFNPARGQRFNHHKLLLDPYARMLHGEFKWHPSHFAYQREGNEDQDLSFCTADNSIYMPKAVVTKAPDKQGPPAHPNTPWAKSLIYEAHVRGLTRLHPDIPLPERGCFAGMARAEVVDYLKALGVTAVQLLPVQAFIDEFALHERGLSNYWGYNTLGFFTPHPAYLSGPDIMEFRRLVDSYHAAGIEVLLDVVYNHSCESDELGPTLSLRGIDNQSYYRLRDDDPRFYVNDTGCGNTLNIDHPQVRRLVIDSLVYWADTMGVDGFRFDLATVLGRGHDGFQREHAFFAAVRTEPALAHCKLIAEPWDIGPGGYQLGNFPPPWSEWNDRYRDSLRRFWRGDPGELPELARRIHGSADVFEESGRPPSGSINYLCSHDGFTLRDLVSHSERHNLANAEDNRDGHRENYSANHGHEGPTPDPEINAARQQQQRNFLALLALSQGVPMLQAGDELDRTTQGNNNAYCQDTALNWINWESGLNDAAELLAFTRKVFQLRRELPLLQADHYRHESCDSPAGGMLWFAEDGQPMRPSQWHEHDRCWLGFLLRRHPATGTTDELLVLINAGDKDKHFQLPQSQAGNGRPNTDWCCVLDTARPDTVLADVHTPASSMLDAHSVQLFIPGTSV